MADGNAENWSPKTRDDWKGLFSESFKDAITGIRSADEEAAAKAAAEGNNEDKDGKDDSNNGSGKGKSFADRLLGI